MPLTGHDLRRAPRRPTALLALVGLMLAGARPLGAGELPQAEKPAPAHASEKQLVGDAPPSVDARQLAARVTIYRDRYGVPHIDGVDDAATLFGFAYAQAEDYFWQVEDSYLLSLGRYSEVHGPAGLNSDVLNRAFEVVVRSQADFALLEPTEQRLLAAFAAGLNHYLDTHPEVQPRALRRFEPWHVVAFGRHMRLETTFRYLGLSDDRLPRRNPLISSATGSNAVAIGPSRSSTGRALLVIAPHQPWFGFGQMYEAHLRSGDGWNFAGATFFGSPMPSLGHNDHLGWALTTNEPNIADTWRVTFDHPTDPLSYRYDGGYRQAEQWQETVQVRVGGRLEPREYAFRKTHYGPIVRGAGSRTQWAARIAGLHDTNMLRQVLAMVRAESLAEFRHALARQQLPLMNIVYADRDGNIFYLYNGLIPRRDDRFDWRQPLDGADPRCAWGEYHRLDELPQVINPTAGYVQNCNSSPLTTCRDSGLVASSYPSYMMNDLDDDRRRARVTRQLVEADETWTFEKLPALVFDTTNYWAENFLPHYERAFETLKKTQPRLAASVEPYFNHLLAWDGHTSADSTAATLCHAWYEELYGAGYPGEQLRRRYASDMPARFRALQQAARSLQAMHGDWRVAWGQVYRIQRHANVADLVDIPFSDAAASLPSTGAHGPMGVFFTQYYTPSIYIPFLRETRRRYAVVGCAYLGVFEFGDTVRGATLTPFGQSGDPASPHFFDQAELFSQGRLKPELFHWDDVRSQAVARYHPGEQPAAQ